MNVQVSTPRPPSSQVSGPQSVNIRKFVLSANRLRSLVELGSLSPPVAAFLEVKRRSGPASTSWSPEELKQEATGLGDPHFFRLMVVEAIAHDASVSLWAESRTSGLERALCYRPWGRGRMAS